MNRPLAKLKHYAATVGWRGTAAYCMARMLGRKPVFAAQVAGLAHPVFVRLGSTDVSVMKQVLIEKHYDFPVTLKPKRIIDAGANIGLSAVYFANRFPDAQIVAIEPEKSNFDILQKNIAAYPNIKPMFAALWPIDDEIQLLDPGTGNHGFQTSSSSKYPETRGQLTKAVCVGTILKERGWDSVDLLKVDIEGSEKELFESCDSWIGSVQIIMAELHDNLRPGCSAAFAKATKGFSSGGHCGESVMVHRS